MQVPQLKSSRICESPGGQKSTLRAPVYFEVPRYQRILDLSGVIEKKAARSLFKYLRYSIEYDSIFALATFWSRVVCLPEIDRLM